MLFLFLNLPDDLSTSGPPAQQLCVLTNSAYIGFSPLSFNRWYKNSAVNSESSRTDCVSSRLAPAHLLYPRLINRAAAFFRLSSGFSMYVIHFPSPVIWLFYVCHLLSFACPLLSFARHPAFLYLSSAFFLRFFPSSHLM